MSITNMLLDESGNSLLDESGDVLGDESLRVPIFNPLYNVLVSSENRVILIPSSKTSTTQRIAAQSRTLYL